MNTVVKERSSELTKDLGGQEMRKCLRLVYGKITMIHPTHVILLSLQAKRYARI